MINALILILFMQLWSSVLQAGQQDSNDAQVYFSETGYAEFTSSVPLHTFTGKSSHLIGMIDLNKNIVDFYLDLTTLETGIGRRDRDMYRTLNVEDHPFAEFYGTLDSGFSLQIVGKQNVTAKGEFKVNGVTRDVNIEGTLQNQGENLYLEAEWTLRLVDYEIEPPGILFYRVNEEQEIRIEVTLKPHNRNEIPVSN